MCVCVCVLCLSVKPAQRTEDCDFTPCSQRCEPDSQESCSGGYTRRRRSLAFYSCTDLYSYTRNFRHHPTRDMLFPRQLPSDASPCPSAKADMTLQKFANFVNNYNYPGDKWQNQRHRQAAYRSCSSAVHVTDGGRTKPASTDQL